MEIKMRNLRKIPCAQTSILVGLSAGAVIGALSTWKLSMCEIWQESDRICRKTSSPFFGYSVECYCDRDGLFVSEYYHMSDYCSPYCRYQYATQRSAINQIQEAEKQKRREMLALLGEEDIEMVKQSLEEAEERRKNRDVFAEDIDGIKKKRSYW